MIEFKLNTGFTANTQNEEKVKSFCKYFFERDNAQICKFVNTLSEKILNIPYAQINGNVNTFYELFSEIFFLHDELLGILKDMAISYHYAMRYYPISMYVMITKRYAALRCAYKNLIAALYKLALNITNAHFDVFVKSFSESFLKNFEEV